MLENSRVQNTSDVNFIHTCTHTLLLSWYSHYIGHTYSHPHLSAITHVSHFTWYVHTKPRPYPLGMELSLTDGLTSIDSYILICFPSHTHTEESKQQTWSFTAEWSFLGLLLDLSTTDGSGEAGLEHNTHHMSPGNHREQNKAINRLSAASRLNSFTGKWPQIHSSFIDRKILKHFQFRIQMRNLFLQ